MSIDRYYFESVSHYNEHNDEWSDQWLVSDLQRFGWLFEIKCASKAHAIRVAIMLNFLDDQDISQEDARVLARELNKRVNS